MITATTFLELKLTATRLGLHYNLRAALVKARGRLASVEAATKRARQVK
jgi:hypothetical protein